MAILLYTFVLLAGYYLYTRRPSSSTSRLLPPGPAPVPVLGNLFDLTTKELWVRITNWSRIYGDVVYIHLFGQGLVFCNTAEAATDLLDRKGAIYSDKPALIMTGDLCGCENMVAMTRYGDKSRRQRRLMTTALSTSACRAYRPLLADESLTLVRRMLSDPSSYLGYLRQYAGGLTLQAIYGYRAESHEDAFLTLGMECVDILSNEIASGGGIWPVDIFPFLRHLPLWAPGAGFLRKAIVWRAKMQEFVDKPYELVKERMREGTAVPCFVTTLLTDVRDGKEVDAQRDFDIRWTANSMYSASMDTTITVVTHFMHAMLTHPDVLSKVQAEMDAVTGNGARLPTFEDREALPYLEAVMSEVLRWGVPVPLGLPHRLMEDDVYNDMFIPKGTLVFANIWNMLRNEDLYPNADAFLPSRFLVSPTSVPLTPAQKKALDPRTYVFGFGRRICPGMHLIEESLWIVMATMVATLDLKNPVDERGRERRPKVRYENAVFRTPTAFPCDIRPRSEGAMQLLREAEL
ncbi:cytochrome P450 [Trametopsis cervina]|nr:cytochrome P450 [Trametopsis cervina]